MKLVVFGLSISSSWGNGHATLWRALCTALERRGHQIVFFERDVPYYAATRDTTQPAGCRLYMYRTWEEAASAAHTELRDSDAAMVTSYCPDGLQASRLVVAWKGGLRVFYDLDTPVTLANLQSGARVDYLPPEGLGAFDLVLSYTGGEALKALRDVLGARRVSPLYGSVDPEVHRPSVPSAEFSADLSYLGTYAEDRQDKLELLLVEPARRLAEHRFVIGGAQYPTNFPWADNIYFVRHLPPVQHPSFYSSSRLTLNITRRAMAAMGFCPSGRLFEAAACGVPMITDWWEGLDQFYRPGEEIIVCRTTEEVMDAIRLPADALRQIAEAAKERTLFEHTASVRAIELETMLKEDACTVQT